MSLFSDYNKTVRPETTAATSGLAPVADKKEDKHSAAKTVLIFTPSGDRRLGGTARGLQKKCAAGGVSSDHVAASGPKLASTITQLRTEGKIGNDTQIIISMHGVIVDDGDSKVDLALAHEDAELENAGSALEILEAIRKPLEGSDETCSATVYIASCGAGAEDFVNRVQELHNRYKAGVCFLLSSKADVSEEESNIAMNAVCNQFVSAKRSAGQSPTPDHIFAVLTAQAGDCMSMVVANEARPRRVHAPKSESDAGAEALIRRLDHEALIFSEKGASHGLLAARSGIFAEGAQLPKATISGDLAAMEDYQKALLGLSGPEKETQGRQYFRIAEKLALQSNWKTLAAHIETSPGFARMREQGWNGAHEGLIELFHAAYRDQDLDAERSDQKLRFLMNSIFERYSRASEDTHLRIMKELFKDNPELFDKLNKAGFFIRSGGQTEKNLQSITVFLARKSNLAHLRDVLDFRPDPSTKAAAEIWRQNLSSGQPEAIRLSLQLIDAAATNEEDSDAIIDYVIATIRTCKCEPFLKAQYADILENHIDAFGILTLKDII
ncbi:MAG: hypothetical protein ACR652_15480 [Methylocystis sp.]|uniref:hypothetical protein n=1 Tax=Methylocystis sp. TaxID=1911079 RepID=UPI003DA3678F